MDKRRNNPGRPVGSKDSSPRGPKKVSQFSALQNRFKIASDKLFTDKDIANIIEAVKELATIDRDPKMLQFLLAKMWDTEKAKEVNVTFSHSEMREVLGDICDDFENAENSE